MASLQDITLQESGVIEYKDGQVFVINWSAYDGIPSCFMGGHIDMIEIKNFKRIKLSTTGYMAIREHEKELGESVSKSGFKSWSINDGLVIVTTQEEWN